MPDFSASAPTNLPSAKALIKVPATSPRTLPRTSPGSSPSLLPKWEIPTSQPALARFADWTQRYLEAEPTRQLSLVEEGVELATKRRREMIDLIEGYPAEALAMAVPAALRETMPAEVQGLLEEHVSGRGDLSVLGVLGEPGKENEVVPVIRTATLHGRDYDAFVYGRRLGEPTRRSVLLHGVTLDGKMAVHENRLRVRPRSAGDSPVIAEALCAVSGRQALLSPEPVVVDAGEETLVLCSPTHLQPLEARLAGAEENEGGHGGGAGVGYTEGVKRLLLIRVDFSDLVGEPFSSGRGTTLVEEVNEFYVESSYGRASFALVGAGSEVTPVFRLPQTAEYYGNNNRYNELRSDARTAAAAGGYVLANYNFDIICLGRVPGFTWAGLGFVGSAGSWVRNTSAAGVAAHELGHNFGLNHANFWNTIEQGAIGLGESVEYGDIFDTMGSASAGARHFNARYKSYLNWLTSAERTFVSSSGTYRLHAHDDPSATGVRALRIVKDVSRNYWVELRQKFTGNKWLLNGVGLRWAGNGNERSNLLDATPGSPDGKNDSPLLIGRTFSDRIAGVHITPVRKGSTEPEWMDVVVELGQFPSNQAPTLSIIAGTLMPGPGMATTLTASAHDPNGDELSYFWDFGDGETGTNSFLNSHAWTGNGEYRVQCTVSDMKGGRATDSLIVRIGSPTTFRISGRVSANGRPLEGVRVYLPSGAGAFTDSDGTYQLVGVASGTYSVSAAHEGYLFTRAGFVNPVQLGPNATGVDFLGGDPGSQNKIALVPPGAIWKFLDDGSLVNALWTGRSFDDSAWNAGPAELGYGDDDEATLLDFGPSAAAKFLTTYFRHSFVVEQPSDFSVLELGLLRDDGAVVYLNGREVFRSNMPGGVITPTTPAATTAGGSDENVFFTGTIDPVWLVPGTNIIAVEVHQVNAPSSDLSFDFRLNGVIASNNFITAGAIWKYLDSGAAAGDWTANTYDDAAWASGPGQLGYGDGDEATILSFGSNSANKPITTYFRKTFVLPSGIGAGGLTLGVLRDDGAVVYLNGREVFRSNMPGGEITADTRAILGVGATDESTFYETAVDASLLVAGTNVLAVEVHQNAVTSSDLSFDARLHGFGVLNVSRSIYLETPLDGAQIELGTSLTIEARAAAGYGRRIRMVEFYDGTQKIGEVTAAPYRLVWNSSVTGLHTLTATATDTSSNTFTSLPAQLTITFPMVSTQLVPPGAFWKYSDTGQSLDATWTTPDYVDTLWKSGRARLGYGADGEVTTINAGPSGSKFITTYFRRAFNLISPAAASHLTVRLIRDDGAVVYLNGTEVFRNNMPPGSVSYNTLATATVGGSDERIFLQASIFGAPLVAGRNVVAVEVHQVNAASSDMGFDLELIGAAPADQIVPTLDWQRSGEDLVFSWMAALPGFDLHTTSDASSPGTWAIVTGPLTLTNGIKVRVVVPDDQNRFFRLMRP